MKAVRNESGKKLVRGGAAALFLVPLLVLVVLKIDSLPQLTRRHDEEFNLWFENAMTNSEPSIKKGARSTIILTMWRLWKTRNDAVFKNTAPNRHDLVQSILEEAKLWMLAGAKALRRLPLHARPPDDNQR